MKRDTYYFLLGPKDGAEVIKSESPYWLTLKTGETPEGNSLNLYHVDHGKQEAILIGESIPNYEHVKGVIPLQTEFTGLHLRINHRDEDSDSEQRELGIFSELDAAINALWDNRYAASVF